MAALDIGHMWLMSQQDSHQNNAGCPSKTYTHTQTARKTNRRPHERKNSAQTPLAAASPASSRAATPSVASLAGSVSSLSLASTSAAPALTPATVAPSASTTSFFNLSGGGKKTNRRREREELAAQAARAVEEERQAFEEWRRQQRLRDEAVLRNEDAGKARARAFLDDFIVRSQWADIREHITIVWDAVPTMAEMEAWGEMPEAVGTVACRRLFRAPVVWDQLGRGLYEKLRTVVEQKRDALAGLSPLLENNHEEESAALESMHARLMQGGLSGFGDAIPMSLRPGTSAGPNYSPSFYSASSNASSPAMSRGRFRSGSLTSASDVNSTAPSSTRISSESKRSIGHGGNMSAIVSGGTRWSPRSQSRPRQEEPARPSTAGGYSADFSSGGIGLVRPSGSPLVLQGTGSPVPMHSSPVPIKGAHSRFSNGGDDHCNCCSCTKDALSTSPAPSRVPRRSVEQSRLRSQHSTPNLRGSPSARGSPAMVRGSPQPRGSSMARVMTRLVAGSPQPTSAFDTDYTDDEGEWAEEYEQPRAQPRGGESPSRIRGLFDGNAMKKVFGGSSSVSGSRPNSPRGRRSRQ